MTKIDFSGLKQKLMASIVAISAIQVLKAFMNIDKSFNERTMMWLVIVHLFRRVRSAPRLDGLHRRAGQARNGVS